MDNESMAKEERTAMNAAAADLLAVKLLNPGWPGLKPSPLRVRAFICQG
jgi:hypothetical protein